LNTHVTSPGGPTNLKPKLRRRRKERRKEGRKEGRKERRKIYQLNIENVLKV